MYAVFQEVLADPIQRMIKIRRFSMTDEKAQELLADKELSDEELALVAGGVEFCLPDGGVLEVSIVPGAVKVVNATGVVEVYTVLGVLYAQVPATGGEQTIPVPKGIYVVKNNKYACKLIIR
jgi:hypothetical protein